ncbi:MAG: hypothetical protein RI947_1069 [Candidatus Parcubacteria bacterium]|jgi:L-threonylcarbamoyladenylate synthase
MKITPISTIDETKVASVLRAGGLVVAPSDTVYGMLVDATQEKAVRKLLAFKNRPIGKPISVFADNMDMLFHLTDVNQTQRQTLARFLPGPFTVILQSKHNVCKLLESERGTLGARIPDYPFITSLVKSYGSPLTATSANIAGKSPHYSIETFLRGLSQSKTDLIDLVIDAGKLPHNKPSTVVDMSTSEVRIIRRGDIVWKDSETYISESPAQTRKIAEFVLNTILRGGSGQPVVVFLEGDLGSGKTEFVKGMAQHLNINNIISPTYVIYYEYPIQKNNFKYLYHFDLYQIEEEEEFKHLGIETMMKPGNLLCMEWGEKAGTLLPLLRDKAKIFYITISYTGPDTREIVIKT